eukprot:483876-Pyramimonas_sp.AAC.1
MLVLLALLICGVCVICLLWCVVAVVGDGVGVVVDAAAAAAVVAVVVNWGPGAQFGDQTSPDENTGCESCEKHMNAENCDGHRG